MNRRGYKRALSTVVTSAILISAIAVMGTMVVTWANMKLNSQEESLSLTFTDSINKLNEDFIVENVWYDYVLNNVNVTITNVGIIGLNVTEIKFTDPSDSSGFVTLPITNGGILVQESFNTNVTYSGLTSGDVFNVVVTSERGNIIQKQVLPP
jgi:archaellum component FlaF (FlaF/FlaG flagellin family)